MCWEQHFTSSLPPKNTPSRSNHQKKYIRQIFTEEHFTKYMTQTLQNCQGHQNEGKSENVAKKNLRRHDN